MHPESEIKKTQMMILKVNNLALHKIWWWCTQTQIHTHSFVFFLCKTAFKTAVANAIYALNKTFINLQHCCWLANTFTILLLWVLMPAQVQVRASSDSGRLKSNARFVFYINHHHELVGTSLQKRGWLISVHYTPF